MFQGMFSVSLVDSCECIWSFLDFAFERVCETSPLNSGKLPAKFEPLFRVPRPKSSSFAHIARYCTHCHTYNHTMPDITSVQQVVEATTAALNAQGAELVNKVKGVVAYNLGDDSFTVDLKNGSGSVSKGAVHKVRACCSAARLFSCGD